MTSTMRVDICYRPLRIGWAVREGDFEAIRTAMRYSHALWGGRFNPIITVDNENEAKHLVEKFRVDLIWPIGDSQQVKNFPKKFAHLISPFFGQSIFVKDDQFQAHYSQVLDISNALSHWYSNPEWKDIKEDGIRRYRWSPDDPLADIFLSLLGEYPDQQEVGTDYLEIFSQAADPVDFELLQDKKLPSDIFDHASLSMPGQLGVARHGIMPPSWNWPGFFVGNAKNFADLVCHWNLRASDIPVWFIDPDHIDRYSELIPELEKIFLKMVEHRHHELGRSLGIWSRQDIPTALSIFNKKNTTLCPIVNNFWSGDIISVPMMHLGNYSTLGVMDDSNKTPRVNFALTNKPFNNNFFSQQLVASIAFSGIHGEEHYTFDAPYIPELNEFYSRNMHCTYNKLRSEQDRVGLIIKTTDHDSFLNSLSAGDLLSQIFLMAGLNAELSNSGRIVRQLITQLGGLQGGRIFKIPGVRELIKKFGPRSSFSKRTAVSVITDKKQGSPATFPEHVNLHLSPRPPGTPLTPPDVFGHMVDKGLFRIGIDLNCSKCGMSSWIALDGLKQEATCELCGHTYNATKQIFNSEWAFRRSGLLGAERNIQGAIPVALTLQQLNTTFDLVFSSNIYSPSMDLNPTKGSNHHKCEVDFVWLLNGHHFKPSDLIIAECKDQGPISPADFLRDVENMRQIADSIPKQRFKTYILFVKLAPFTEEEISIARTLNGKYENRVILLTARELEPYQIYERLKDEYDIKSYAAWPKDLAEMTRKIYFENQN